MRFRRFRCLHHDRKTGESWVRESKEYERHLLICRECEKRWVLGTTYGGPR